jgi:hypothetical protein
VQFPSKIIEKNKPVKDKPIKEKQFLNLEPINKGDFGYLLKGKYL